MNILIISQYFWPENFRINELAKYLSKKNNITVMTGRPTYPHKKVFFKNKNIRKYGSIKIIRLPTYSRKNSNISIILNYLSFIFFSILYSLKFIINSNFDKIIVFGTSPPSGLLVAHIIRIFKKIPIYYWVLDLWPETLTSIGYSKKNIFYIMLDKFMNYSYSNCTYIFCQSRSIKNLISKKLKISNKTIYFPSWSEDLPLKKKKNYKNFIKKKNFNIMFTGNIGEAQDFESIVKASILLKRENIKWIIIGTGRYIKKLKLLVSKYNIKKNFIFMGSQKSKYINYLTSLSDVLLISLKKNPLFSITVPGKLSNYMKSKKPIIGIISGETKKIIYESNCGFCCDAGDYNKLAVNILKLKKKNKQEKTKLGINGYKYAKKFFNKKDLFTTFENHLSD